MSASTEILVIFGLAVCSDLYREEARHRGSESTNHLHVILSNRDDKPVLY